MRSRSCKSSSALSASPAFSQAAAIRNPRPRQERDRAATPAAIPRWPWARRSPPAALRPGQHRDRHTGIERDAVSRASVQRRRHVAGASKRLDQGQPRQQDRHVPRPGGRAKSRAASCGAARGDQRFGARRWDQLFNQESQKPVVQNHGARPFLDRGAVGNRAAVLPHLHHQGLAGKDRLGETHIELPDAFGLVIRHGGKNGAAGRAVGAEPVQDGAGKAHQPWRKPDRDAADCGRRTRHKETPGRAACRIP